MMIVMMILLSSLSLLLLLIIIHNNEQVHAHAGGSARVAPFGIDSNTNDYSSSNTATNPTTNNSKNTQIKR